MIETVGRRRKRAILMVKVRFFASLRERIGIDQRDVGFDRIDTVADVWRAATGGQPPPGKLLCAVNYEFADFQASVDDGDEVAFFPPVTGG